MKPAVERILKGSAGFNREMLKYKTMIDGQNHKIKQKNKRIGLK